MSADVRWSLKVHPLAVDELRAIQTHRPDVFGEIEETLLCLRMEQDVRHPKNPRLNVCPLRDTNNEWFRVKTFRDNYRILVRVLQQRGGRLIEVHEYTWLDKNASEQAVQVVHAGPRSTVYMGLRRLVNKVKGAA